MLRSSVSVSVSVSASASEPGRAYAHGRARLRGDLACVIAGAALVTAAVWMLGLSPALLPWAYLAATAPWLVRIDMGEHRLPNRVVLPGFGAWAAGAVWSVIVDPGGGAALVSLACGAGYALLLGAMAWWGGMGGGDLKLGTLLGLALGLVSVPAAMVALPLAFLAGAIAALFVIAKSPLGARRGRSIPFGPWLLLGAAAALWMARGL